MRYYIDSDGVQKRYYKINTADEWASSPFVGVTADGRQVIADFYSGPRFATLGEPPEPDMVAHWFSPEGDFLGYERRPMIWDKGAGGYREQMQAWLSELGVTEGVVEVKMFSCESGMYIVDPMIDMNEFGAEYDFDDAKERGIYHLYWEGRDYIGNGEGGCSR